MTGAHFARPEYLALLLAVPILLAYMAVRDAATRRRRDRLADPHLFPLLSLGEPGHLRAVRRALLLSGMAALAVATARPLGAERFESFDAKGVDIVFALDVSESMRAEDMRPGNRLQVTKIVVGDFIKKLEFDRVGIVAFAGDASVVCPLTLDHDTAVSFLNGVDFNAVQKGGTNLAEAIATANDRFVDGRDVARVIVLLTDGEEQEGGAVEVARKVAEGGARIYTIGIGDRRGVPIPVGRTVFGETVYKRYKGEVVVTKLEEKTLQDIAFVSGGKYYHVTNNRTLQEVLDEIRTMDRRVVRVSTKAVRGEAFQPFLILALVLLVAAFLLRERRSQFA